MVTELRDVGRSRFARTMNMFMMAPRSTTRHYLDLLEAVMIAADVIATPFTICFAPPGSTLGNTVRLLLTILWMVDIVINFFTGYSKNGKIELEWKSVARHYLSTWLLFDILLVAIDLLRLVVLLYEQDFNEMMFRLLGALRALRLLRLCKLQRMLQEIHSVESGVLRVLLAILARVCIIGFVTHIIACGWYLCSSGDETKGWVEFYEFGRDSIGTKYLVALHWAITQVHGNIEIGPQNDVERVYAVVMVFTALFIMTILIGNFANLFQELLSTRNYNRHQLWLLHRYLKQLRVGHGVLQKIETHLMNVLKRKLQEVSGDDVEILVHLPPRLASELKAASYLRHTSTHRVLAHIFPTVDDLVYIVDCLAANFFFSGDIAFKIGDEGLDFCCFADGGAVYSHSKVICDEIMVAAGLAAEQGGTSGNDDQQPEMSSWSHWEHEAMARGEQITEGQWICEPVIWLEEWVGLGDCFINSPCEVIGIHARTFQNRVREHSKLFEPMVRYATAYVKVLNTMDSGSLSDLNTVAPPIALLEAGLSGRAAASNISSGTNSFGLSSWAMAASHSLGFQPRTTNDTSGDRIKAEELQ